MIRKYELESSDALAKDFIHTAKDILLKENYEEGTHTHGIDGPRIYKYFQEDRCVTLRIKDISGEKAEFGFSAELSKEEFEELRDKLIAAYTANTLKELCSGLRGKDPKTAVGKRTIDKIKETLRMK